MIIEVFKNSAEYQFFQFFYKLFWNCYQKVIQIQIKDD